VRLKEAKEEKSTW